MPLRLSTRQARLVVFGYNAITSKIEWMHSPYSPQYAGSPLSLAGGQVFAFYKDGTVSDITDVCGFNPTEGSTLQYAGEQNINARYTDHCGHQFTADTKITVADVEKLLFTGLAKEIQKEGESLDLSGAVLAAQYTDGTVRPVDASGVVFSPAAGAILGHTETLTIQARWRNPDTGSEYYAQHPITVDTIEGIYFSHGPDKIDYAQGEPLDLTGVEVTMKYKLSGDTVIVTDLCTFNPPDGTIMYPYGTILHATCPIPSGGQCDCETILNVEQKTIPIETIGRIIGEDLGLIFTNDLPADFWSGFYPQDVPYIPVDGDYYITEANYSAIVNYLNTKGAFSEYETPGSEQYGNIPFMIIPAGSYYSADGKNAIIATADIYVIATMMKKNGRPETLPSPSCVDYPYTNLYAYNQIHVLTFTMNASDYVRCDSGLKGDYNSATSGICRKMAGLGLPDVSDDTMFTNYVTFPDKEIVNIPGILSLPWCWYDDVPHNLNTLKQIVQGGQPASGCTGIEHSGKVPYLTYSKGSLYAEVKEQFPELFGANVTYGDTTYVKIEGRA